MIKMLLALALGITGCGQDKKKNDDRPQARPAPTGEGGFGLQGLEATNWLSVCLPSETGKSSVQVTYRLQDSSMVKSSNYYDYSDCKAEEQYAERIVQYNNISISESTEIAGSKLINLTISSMQFIARKDDFTASLNKETVYGHNDWTTNESKEVAGKSYSSDIRAEWAAGKALELIYKIEVEKMFFAYFDDKDKPYYKPEVYFLKQ